MFDKKWFSGLAFGLMGGLVFTTIIYAWLSGGLPGWWQHDGELVSSKDTLPQWAMAIFGIIATGLSAWAVILLSRTLDQTETTTNAALEAAAAAREANAIMQSERRPWLSFNSLNGHVVGHRPYEFSDAHMQFEFKVEIKNAGGHSAQNVRLDWKLTDSNNRDEMESFFDEVLPSRKDVSGFVAPSITISREFIVPYRWPITSRMSQNKLFWLFLSVSYDFPYTKRRFQTAEVFMLSHNIEGPYGIGISSPAYGDVAYEQIIGINRSAVDGKMT